MTRPVDDIMMATHAIGRPTGRWGKRLATVTALYHLGRQTWQHIEKRRSERTYQVTIPEHDEIYSPVQTWVLERMPASDQRALVARTVITPTTRRRHDPFAFSSDDIDTDTPSPRQVTLGFDGNRSQRITLDGHVVRVRVEREGDDLATDSQAMRKPRKVIFEAPDMAAREAVVRFLQSVADSLATVKRKPHLVAASRWGEWTIVRDLPTRSLDTVVLPEGHLDAITDDLTQFLASEYRYTDIGVPWHRGYLFHGPPGTGKTTTARALASSLGLDVYYLNVSDLDKDTSLHQLIGAVPARTVLLLEDIDVAHAATDRDDDRKGVTLAGLLNALDGVATPHGLITIMTTNDRTTLDPALIRRGRVDHEVEMSWLVPEQFGRLVEALTGVPCRLWEHYDADLGAGVPFPRLTAADVVGVVAEHMHDPKTAAKEALALLDQRSDHERRRRENVCEQLPAR